MPYSVIVQKLQRFQESYLRKANNTCDTMRVGADSDDADDKGEASQSNVRMV
jgi:hypothetical protein